MSTTATDATYAAQTRLPTILGVLTTFFILALLTVVLRIYTRAFITRSLGIDDALIVLAVFCQLGQWIVIMIQSKHGLGRHQSTISTADLVIFNHASFWGNVIGVAIGTMFLKMAIATSLLRLCQSRWYKWILWFLLVIIFLYELVGTLFFFLNCKPMSGSWDFSGNAKCSSTATIKSFGLVNTSFNILTDVSLAIVPIPIIWSLQLKKRVRLYLIGVLSLGYLAVIMDIVKTVYQETYTATVDETYTFSLITFGNLEDCLGLIAASAPMLKPLIGKAIGIESTSNTYYEYGNNRDGTNGRQPGGSRNISRGNRKGTVNSQTGAPSSYELQERDNASDGSASAKGNTATMASVYRHDAESEESILQNAQPNFQNKAVCTRANSRGPPHGQAGYRGITKTTEVVVR